MYQNTATRILCTCVQEEFEDIKGEHIIRKYMNTRQTNVGVFPIKASCKWISQYEEFDDTKGVIIVIIRKSKNRQRNGQNKEDERTNNDLENPTQIS
jgi:hypothetical protein